MDVLERVLAGNPATAASLPFEKAVDPEHKCVLAGNTAAAAPPNWTKPWTGNDLFEQ